MHLLGHGSVIKKELSDQLLCYSGDTKAGDLHVMLEISIFIQCQHAGVNAFLLTSECYKQTCPQTHNVTYEF